MFRWASPQPISTELKELPEQAGGCHSGPGEDPEVTVYLPPHLLLAPRDGRRGRLESAYAGLDDSNPPERRLANGERRLGLLGLRPTEMAHGLLGHPLQRPLELAAVDPLLAAWDALDERPPHQGVGEPERERQQMASRPRIRP